MIISIDYDCRVCNKPIRWDYYNTGPAQKGLPVVVRPDPAETAASQPLAPMILSLTVPDAAKRIEINHADMDVRIIGNFDVETLSCESRLQ